MDINYEKEFNEYMSESLLTALPHALFHADSIRTFDPVLIRFIKWAIEEIKAADAPTGQSASFLLGQIIYKISPHLGDNKNISEIILENIDIFPESDEIFQALLNLRYYGIKEQWFEGFSPATRSQKVRGLLEMMLLNLPHSWDSSGILFENEEFCTVVKIFKKYGVPLFRSLTDKTKSTLMQSPSSFFNLLRVVIGDEAYNYHPMIAAVGRAIVNRGFENCVHVITTSIEYSCVSRGDTFISMMSKEVKKEAIKRIIEKDYKVINLTPTSWSAPTLIAIQKAMMSYLDKKDLNSLLMDDELVAYLGSASRAKLNSYQIQNSDEYHDFFEEWLKDNLNERSYQLYVIFRSI